MDKREERTPQKTTEFPEQKFNVLLGNYNPREIGTILQAKKFAEEMHKGQTRDDGTPYFNHCLATAILAMEEEEKAYLVCAAFLHDTLEDTGTTIKELSGNFGQRVAGLVEILSKRVEDGAKKNLDDYYSAIGKSPEAVRLKAYDRMANLLCLPSSPIAGKKERYLMETRRNIVPMVNAASPDLAERMNEIIRAIE